MSTFVAASVVLLVVALAIRSIMKNRGNRFSCRHGCENCATGTICIGTDSRKPI